MPWCNTEAMAQHLAAIAAKIEPGRYAVLLLDQASWHMSAHLVVPETVDRLPTLALPHFWCRRHYPLSIKSLY